MKKPLLTILLICLFQTFLLAQKSLSKSTSYSHLFEVNSQWGNHKELASKNYISFDNEDDRISFHLTSVINNLINKTPQNISKVALENRLELLGKLQKYANDKIFPTNSFHSIRTPYFVDVNGVHCAVGYLMKESNATDLVKNISTHYNFDYIKDIKTEGVAEWAKQNGFSIKELEWIQPTYGLPYGYKTVLEGSNGEIKTIKKIYYSTPQTVIIMGAFDTLNNLPCLNIGYYNDSVLNCYGDGLKGIINNIDEDFEGIYAAGKIENENVFYSIANYVNNEWVYINIPSMEGAMATAVFANYNGFVVSIINTNNDTEIWYYSYSSSTWAKKATVFGKIKQIKNTYLGVAYVGHFNNAYINGSELDTIETNNVLIAGYEGWFTVGNQVSDTIYDLESKNNSIYFAGNCSDENNICLSRYLNDDLQPLILKEHFSDTSITTIKDIYLTGNTIVYGGKFELSEMMGEWGRNLASYNIVDNYSTPLSTLNNDVSSVSYINNNIIVGGAFNSDNYSDIKYLAKFDKSHYMGVDEEEPVIDPIKELKSFDLTVSPNPFISVISIPGDIIEYNYILFNGKGELLEKGRSQYNKITIEESIDKGIYILKLTSKNREFVQKIIKI